MTDIMPLWMDSAACRSPEYDPEWWFALPGTAEEHAALRVCMGCTVRGACLSWARDTHADYGIFGGLTEQQRRGRASRLVDRPPGQSVFVDIEHIRQLAGAGHSDREIAQALDTTTNRVEHLRRRHDIRAGRWVRKQPRSPSGEELAQLIAADRAGHTARQIADRLDVTVRTVERWRARLRAEVAS